MGGVKDICDMKENWMSMCLVVSDLTSTEPEASYTPRRLTSAQEHLLAGDLCVHE